MTEVEALNNIRTALEEVNQCINSSDVVRVPSEAYIMKPSLEIAIDAIEKQISKKPLQSMQEAFIRIFGEWLVCPNCEESVNGTHFNYCPHCGQRLDWS